MRVTFVLAEANLSGGVRVVAEHAKMLHERGHEVTIVCYPPQRTTIKKKILNRLRGRKIKVHPGRSHLDGSPFAVRFVARGKPICLDDVPDGDIVVATWWETAEWVWGMPAEKGLKVHFIQGYEAFSWMPRERVHAVWQLPFRKIVVSRWLQGIAESDFGDFQSVLVPNGIDTHRFTPSCQGERNCTVGGLFSGMGKESIKRFWLAAEVVEILQKRRHNLRFVVFGSRPPQSHEQLPRGTCFEFAPAQERIPEIYSSCACWLFTSKEEGYGLPILEAMACGTPVVATPAGAAPELLASGGGTLVNSDDPEAIADAVEAILNLDEASWQAISRAARAEAEKHSWDLIGDKMESALLQILSEGR